jgi:excisionase family DNA binding protein
VVAKITDMKPKKKRKPSSEWNRRTNTVPLTERAAYRLRDVADYLSISVSTLRRLIKRGLIQPLPGLRHIVIARAECDRFLRAQTEITKLAA